MTSKYVVPALQVNAAICSTSTMVHYVDASTANSLQAINGIREFMSETFKKTWASHFDKVRMCQETQPASVSGTASVAL